jgi:hypothetical protein
VIVNRRAYIPDLRRPGPRDRTALGQLVGVYNLGQRLTVRRRPGGHVAGVLSGRRLLRLHPRRRRPEVPGGALHGAPQWLTSQRADPAGPGPRFHDVPLDPAARRATSSSTRSADWRRWTRVFGLPITNPTAARCRSPRNRGGCAAGRFQPYHDGEKLVMASDAGVVGLFGIRPNPQ